MQRIEVVARPLVEVLRHVAAQTGQHRAAAGQEDRVDITRAKAGLGQHLVTDAKGLSHQVERQLLHLVPRDGDDAAALGSRRVDAGNRDGRLLGQGELALRHLARTDEPVEGNGIVAEVPAVARERPVCDVQRDRSVDVVATEVGIATVTDDAERVTTTVDDRGVEGAATKVVDEGVLEVAAVQVCERCGHRLLNDSDAGELGSRDREGRLIAPVLIEADRGGHDGVHLAIGTAREIAKPGHDRTADLRRGNLPGPRLERRLPIGRLYQIVGIVLAELGVVRGMPSRADDALGREDRVLGVHGAAPSSARADQRRPTRQECHRGRHHAAAPFHGHGLEIASEHRVGRTEVDSNGGLPARDHRPNGCEGSESAEVHWGSLASRK